MLRPPSDYQLTKVQLSSHSTKINNLFFDSAIIFFTPKVADKKVDISTLNCTIVQIIDRGEWGKEEVSFTVDASSFSNRKHREFDLTADAEYSLKIIPPPELRMGILEVYFDPNHSNLPSINLPIMGVTNPTGSDPAALQAALQSVIPQMAQAIGVQSGAAVQQALANTAADAESRDSKTSPVELKPWSGNIMNHQILPASPTRKGVHLLHLGKAFNIQNISDVFIAAGTQTGRNQTGYDYVMKAEGEFNNEPNREDLPLFAWVATGKPNTTVTMTEYLPAPVVAA
jgi:hypothetical protein